MTYGAPFEIISDRGKSFLAEGISEFERENSIRHLAPLHTIPRLMGWSKECTRCSDTANNLVADKRDRWDEYLPTSTSSYSDSDSRCYWISPFYYSLAHTLDYQRRNTPRSSLMPLDEIERMEENSEFIARNLEEVGQARSAANVRTKAQAEAMRKRNNFDENTSDYYFKVGDMVKMKHHDRQKLEFNWKGPYHVVDVGHPGTYWIMTPQGLRLPNAVNQADLAPWLAPVIDNVDFFYDGTNRNSSLDS
ncbi:hypothetical protein BASA83_006315 [Batrachochytrium salamandrivorans]|nr:hypothetical protein BASA83_006315 [Batrachochytrium salamandrivorans]